MAGSAAAVWARLLRIALAVQALGAALVGVGGVIAVVDGGTAGAGFSSGLTPSLGLDGLTGVFLAALGAVAAPAVLHPLADGNGRRERCIAVLTGLFVVVLALVLCARDVVTFLAGWELMTLVPAAIILVARSDEAARRTVFAYVAITHLGGVGVWVALLELARLGAIGHPDALAAEGDATIALVTVAALVGFGTKAGLVPFHAWLPRTHPIAPPHVSALMSGVLLKVALYGLVRVLLEWSPPLDSWLGGLVLGAGALSAVGGAVYAAFAGELKQLLAWSSIENVGVIVLGLGAAVLLRGAGDETWAPLALAAALLHVLNHALFKGLLFLGAGSLSRAVGSLRLDRLGGLLTAMPRTGWALVVGALALAAVPPLNGFASEWATLQGLLHLASPGDIGVGVLGVVGLVALAMTAGLAVLGVVRLVGLVLLGPPRTERAAAAREAPASAWAGTAFLGSACVLLGVAPGLLMPDLVRLASGSSGWSGSPALERTPGLDLPATGTLPSAALALALAVVVVVLLAAARGRVAAPSPTWACGQPLDRGLLRTSAGFTKPLRLVAEAVLRPEREIAVERSGGLVRRVSYRGRVPHHLEDVLYIPVRRGALAATAQARRLQTGRLGTYVAYLVGLVVALLAAARIGLLG